MSKHTTIAIDLAKSSFAVVALSNSGRELWRRTLRRKQLITLLSRQEASTVVMEACGSAHYWARRWSAMGHDVQLLPPQHVKGYLRGQKNDYNDALAIAEASLHGRVRPVRPKSIEQQDEQAFHGIRQSLSREKVRLSNQLRGLLLEYGIALAKGYATLKREVPLVLEDAQNELTPRFRMLLQRQYQRLQELETELAWYDDQLKQQVNQDEVCARLIEVPAVGPVVASAVKSWMGDGQQFRRGRDASAALGLVPRQHSTGGRQVLSGITKRGDKYLRSLIIHGARAVVARVDGKTDPLSLWVQRIKATRGYNKAAVALANKLIRILWVIIARGERYRPASIVTA
jgi:transposase